MYLGLEIRTTGNFHKAVNDLIRQEGPFMYQKEHKTQHPNQDLAKNTSVIEPIALYGCEIWGPLTNQEFTKWYKHPIETLHGEFCKKYTLCTMQNPKQGDNTHQLSKSRKALTDREMDLEKSPLSQLVLGLCSQTQTDPTKPQDSNTVRPNKIMRNQKRYLFDTLERMN